MVKTIIWSPCSKEWCYAYFEWNWEAGMEQILKTKLCFNRTQCNVALKWYRKTQALQFSYPWLHWWFSMKKMWLKVTRSNYNPVVPASFYLKTVPALKLCLIVMQSKVWMEYTLHTKIKARHRLWNTLRFILFTTGSGIIGSRKRCHRHWNIRHDKDADLNTDQESSSGAVGSELQIHFDYVVQNENTAYLPYNWIERVLFFATRQVI